MALDHDQRFKTMIREFFADFLNLFFGDWAKRLDLSNVEWLEQELFSNPPDGDRHIVDLVAKVHTSEPLGDPETWLALIHIEIESPSRTTLLKPRLPRYYSSLRDRHGIPVLPIVLYLQIGLEGIGIDSVIDRVWELEVNKFQYLYVGLPGLDAETYLQGDNWLGVALSALMKIPKGLAAEYGAEALRRLAEAASLNEQQRFLLGDCVEAYLPVDAMEVKRFQDILTSNSTEGVRAMNKTTYDRGIEAGIEKGMEKGIERGIERGIETGRRVGQLEFLEAMLDAKFGPLTPECLNRLHQLSDDRLMAIARAIPAAGGLAELGIV